MYEIVLWQSKLVPTAAIKIKQHNTIFAVKKMFSKLWINAFYFTKKARFVFKIFRFLCFSLPRFAPVLFIANFIEGIDSW